MKYGNHKHDLITDVHGCLLQFQALTQKLGHYDGSDYLPWHPDGRRLVVLGDLVDRGPDSAGVIELAMKLRYKRAALFLMGNHDERLRLLLLGHDVPEDQHLHRTVDQIDRRGSAFRNDVVEFLNEAPYMQRTRGLILVHAAYRQGARRETARNWAVFGSANGTWIEYPDSSWESAYTGKRTIVHGHVPVNKPSVRRISDDTAIINIDTGCVFGGELTALRLPEMEFVSSPGR